MAAIGGLLMLYGLALLTSPAWARFGAFGHDDLWLWVRGELYLVFGFVQCFIGVGYIRLTSRPAEAVTADDAGIALRRIYETQYLAWRDIVDSRKGRATILIASEPITFWNVLFRSPAIMRLDTTMIEASMPELAALIDRHKRKV